MLRFSTRTTIYLPRPSSRVLFTLLKEAISPRHLGPTVSSTRVPNMTGVAMAQKNNSFWSLTEGIVSKFMPK